MDLSPDKIAALDAIYGGEQATLAPEKMAALDAIYGVKQENTIKNNEIQSAIQGAAQGMTANFGDEMMAGLTAPVIYAGSRALEAMGTNTNGLAEKSLYDIYASERQKIDAANAQAAQDNPLSYVGGNIVGAVGTGVAGAGTKAGAAIANSVRSGNLAARMGKAAIAGAASGELAAVGAGNEEDRLSNVPSSALLGATIGGVIPAVGASYQLAKDTVAPFTQSGRERIVGQFLQKQAQNPQAIANASANEIVAGSAPTLGQASGDYGLLSLERGLRNSNPADFAARESAANAARNQALNNIAGEAADITAAKAARKAVTDPMYEAAKNAVVKADSTLNEIASRPSFKNAFVRAQQLAKERGETLVIGKDIPAQSVPSQILDATGMPLTKETAEQSASYTGKGLHYIKMAIDDTLDYSPASSIGKNEKSAITSTKTDLLNWLDSKIPEYGKASKEYAKMSKPIEQMETLQDIKGRIMTSVPDPQTGYDFISQAKISNVFQKNSKELAKTLSPEQFKTMGAIVRDLDRASSINAPNIRATGSDTAQNLAARNALSPILGDNVANSSLAQTVMRPVSWAYKIPEQKMRELLIEAMLNPERAKQILPAIKASKISSTALIGAGAKSQDAVQKALPR